MTRLFRALLLVVPGMVLQTGCGTFGGKDDGSDLAPPPKLRGSGDRPVDHLPRTEYPFDEDGNYIVSWAQEGDKKYRSTTSSSSPSRSIFRRSSSSSSRSSSSSSTKKKSTPSTRYHTVKSGDTLWGISRRYGKSVSAIKSANGLRSDTIRSGQRLKIP